MSRIPSKITQHTRKPGKWDSFSSKKIINRDQLHDDSDVEINRQRLKNRLCNCAPGGKVNALLTTEKIGTLRREANI